MRPLFRSQPQISAVEESPRNAARAAGLTYLISFAVIAFVEFGIHPPLINGDPNLQPANAVETARSIP